MAKKDKLSKIYKALSGNSSRHTVVLYGLSGISKTQLAIAYAKQHKAYKDINWAAGLPRR
jgi:hypothetical protein